MIMLSETEQRNLRSVTDVLHFWNTHDIPGILSFYDADITWHNVAMEETYTGKAEVGATLAQLFNAFPDLRFEVLHKIVDGDTVSERWLIQGTHLGTFMGIPPTGRHVEIAGMSMVEMRDGKFVSDHFYFDSGGVMRQLGLLPSLTATQTRVGRFSLWLLVNRKRVWSGLAGALMGGLTLVRLRRHRLLLRTGRARVTRAGSRKGMGR